MAVIDIALSALDDLIGTSTSPYSNTLTVKSLIDVLRNQRQGPNGDKASLPLSYDARWHAKLLELSRPQDSSALGASSNWAFCTLLCATVRTTPHHLVAKHLPHWLDLLVQHLRAADFRTRLAAMLCGAAITVRACAVGSDTRRDISSGGQKLVQPYLNVLAACATVSDKLAAVTAFTEIATASPSLVKAMGPKIISSLFPMFDAAAPAEVRVSRAAGRCLGRVAAAVYGAANVTGVSQFIVSCIGSLHRAFGKIFEGCEGESGSAPVWRQVVESCEFGDLKDCDAVVMQSRAIALCETIVSAVNSTFALPQQHLQQIQQQKLAAGFVFPTEALIDLIRRSLTAIPGFKLLGYVSFFHTISYKLLDTIVVLHGRTIFPLLNTAIMPILTQGFWLCYRAPTPISAAETKAALFHCAASVLRVSGSGGAVCVAKPLIPYIRAELEGLFGDLQPANSRDHRANTGGSSFATATAALGALEAILACCGDLLPKAAQDEVVWMMGVLLRVPAPGALGAAIARCAGLCTVSGVGGLTALLPAVGGLVAGVLPADGVAMREAAYMGTMCEGIVHPKVAPVCVSVPVSQYAVKRGNGGSEKNENSGGENRKDENVNESEDIVMLDDAVPAKKVEGTVFSGQRHEYKPLEFAAKESAPVNTAVEDEKISEENNSGDKLMLNETAEKSNAMFDSVVSSKPSTMVSSSAAPAPAAITLEDYVEINDDEEDEEEEEEGNNENENNAIEEQQEEKNKEEEEEKEKEIVEPEIKRQKTEEKKNVPPPPPPPKVVNNADADLLLMDDGPDEEDDDDDEEFN